MLTMLEQSVERVERKAHFGQIHTSYIDAEALLYQITRVYNIEDTRGTPLRLDKIVQAKGEPERVRVSEYVPFAVDASTLTQVSFVQVGKYFENKFVW